MKTIVIPNGILHLAESKAVCPHCEREIPFDEIEEKWMQQNNHFMRMKCKCKKFIGIAMEMTGDFIAFDLTHKPE